MKHFKPAVLASAWECSSQWPEPASPYDPSGFQDRNLLPCLSRVPAAGPWVGASLLLYGVEHSALTANTCAAWLSWQTRPHTGLPVTSYHADLCNDMPPTWSWALSAHPGKCGKMFWLWFVSCVMSPLDMQWETQLLCICDLKSMLFPSIVNYC